MKTTGTVLLIVFVLICGAWGAFGVVGIAIRRLAPVPLVPGSGELGDTGYLKVTRQIDELLAEQQEKYLIVTGTISGCLSTDALDAN